MEYLELGSEKIPYIIKKSRRRHRLGLYFAPAPSPVLTVESPSGKLGPEVEAFIRKKTRWILRHYANRREMSSKKALFLKDLEAGTILYKGSKLRLKYEISGSRSVRVGDETITIFLRPSDNKYNKNQLLAAALRASSADFLKKRTKELADYTNSEINTIRVKDQNSRWGSCSSKRNINLNWHLIFLLPKLIDYVIVHELMHLREMNHSPRFWNEVARYCPDYKVIDKALNKELWLIGVLR